MSLDSSSVAGSAGGGHWVDSVVNEFPGLGLNCTSYCAMFVLENSLRELIVEELSHVGGQRWYRSRLSGPALDKYKEARTKERQSPWEALVPHHPIYYLDFPHVKDIIVQSQNWQDAFAPIFLNKERIYLNLSSLEGIRNKIAHNRKVSEADLAHITAASSEIAGCLGRDRYVALGLRCTDEPSIANRLREIKKTGLLARRDMIQCEALHSEALALVHWVAPWWFDSEYLGSPIDDVEKFIGLVDEYSSLPRYWGCGPDIEAWIGRQHLEDASELFISEIDACLGEASIG